MGLEAAALRPSAAEAFTGPVDDGAGIGHDHVHPNDAEAFRAGIVDHLVTEITSALGKSLLLKAVVNANSLRFAKHVEKKNGLRITDPAVGTILQEIFLMVRASLLGEPVASSSEDYLMLEEPLRSTVWAIAYRAVRFLKTSFSLPYAKGKALTLNADFDQLLIRNDLRATESLVGSVLQEVWLRVHGQLQA